jgi:hypothetical protein
MQQVSDWRAACTVTCVIITHASQLARMVWVSVIYDMSVEVLPSRTLPATGLITHIDTPISMRNQSHKTMSVWYVGRRGMVWGSSAADVRDGGVLLSDDFERQEGSDGV